MKNNKIKVSAILIALSVFISVNSKTKDSLIYILPDKVEKKFYRYIKKSKYLKFEFYLTNKDSKIKVCISSVKDSAYNFPASITNRFVIIRDKYYPVVCDYDYIFGVDKSDGKSMFGRRDGNVKRMYPIYEGYSVTFDLLGNDIKEGFGIHKKK